MLLFRYEDCHIDRQEQEADERGRDPLHDGILVDGRLRVRHPHRRHQGHRQQRARQRLDLSETSRRSHGLHEQQQSGKKSSGEMKIIFAFFTDAKKFEKVRRWKKVLEIDGSNQILFTIFVHVSFQITTYSLPVEIISYNKI